MAWIAIILAALALMWLAFRITHWWITRGAFNRE
jgi:hypothetical protein